MSKHSYEADENFVTPEGCGKANRQDKYYARGKRKTAPDCKAESDNYRYQCSEHCFHNRVFRYYSLMLSSATNFQPIFVSLK